LIGSSHLTIGRLFVVLVANLRGGMSGILVVIRIFESTRSILQCSKCGETSADCPNNNSSAVFYVSR
jgi:hypothetical protein